MDVDFFFFGAGFLAGDDEVVAWFFDFDLLVSTIKIESHRKKNMTGSKLDDYPKADVMAFVDDVSRPGGSLGSQDIRRFGRKRL